MRDNVATGLGGLTRGLHRIYKPVIAAVNGWALAGGLETALACDIRIASERAMFGSFEARRGYHHGDGGIVRLVNTCGAGVALEMLLTAEPIDAQRALQCNLVSQVVPHERLMEEAELVARQILRNSQTAVRSAKETILDVIGRPLDDQLRIEALNGYACADPEETMALLQRFYDKTDAGRAGEHETPPEPVKARRDRARRAASAPRSPTALRADGMEVVTLDRAAGLRHPARRRARRRSPISATSTSASRTPRSRHDRARPPDDARAVAARHRREPDRRLPDRAGLPRRDARAPLRAHRGDLERRGRVAGCRARSPTAPRRRA